MRSAAPRAAPTAHRLAGVHARLTRPAPHTPLESLWLSPGPPGHLWELQCRLAHRRGLWSRVQTAPSRPHCARLPQMLPPRRGAIITKGRGDAGQPDRPVLRRRLPEALAAAPGVVVGLLPGRLAGEAAAPPHGVRPAWPRGARASPAAGPRVGFSFARRAEVSNCQQPVHLSGKRGSDSAALLGARARPRLAPPQASRPRRSSCLSATPTRCQARSATCLQMRYVNNYVF